MRRLLFWLVFCILGVWGQLLVPGVDFLAAGLMVSMQEEGWTGAVWLLPLFILLQEGMGSLAFGGVVLLYVAFGLAYVAGRWMFEARNLLFVCLMGVVLGFLHGALVQVMTTLQGVESEQARLLREALWQAGSFPVEWFVVSRLHNRFVGAHEPELRY